jgi:hypothetical protein
VLESPEKYTLDSEPELEDVSPEHGTSTREDPDFSEHRSTEPHSVTQAELNDLVQDLNLPKTKAWLLGSWLQQWNFLEKVVKASFYRNRQLNTAKYFSMDGDVLYCNDICGLMEELKL